MASSICLGEITPIVLPGRSDTGLHQLLRLTIINSAEATKATAIVSEPDFTRTADLGEVPPGESTVN